MRRAHRLLVLASTIPFIAGCPTNSTGAPSGCFPEAKAPSLWEILFPPAPTYRFLGSSWYDGKRLLDLSGEFSERTLSPTGRKLAFTGRDSRDDYVLFVAEIGGSIRKVAKVGPQALSLSWTADERSIFYQVQETTRAGLSPDAPADMPGIPDGFSLWRVDLASGQTRSLARLPGNGLMAASPGGDIVALVGFSADKVSSDVKVMRVDTGEERSVATGLTPSYTAGNPVWSPDGKHFGLLHYVPGSSSSVAIFSEPQWIGTDVESRVVTGLLRGWSADGATLNFGYVEPGVRVVRDRYTLGSGATQSASVELEPPPVDKYAGVDWAMLAPDTNRAVLTLSLHPKVLSYLNCRSTRWKNLLVNFDSGAVAEIATGLTPVGWLNDNQILFHSGEYTSQEKKLSVIDL